MLWPTLLLVGQVEGYRSNLHTRRPERQSLSRSQQRRLRYGLPIPHSLLEQYIHIQFYMTIDLKYEQSSIRPRATLLLGNEQSRTMQAPRLEGENGQPSTGEYIQAAPRERAAGDLEIRAGASTEGGAVGYSCAGGKVASCKNLIAVPRPGECFLRARSGSSRT